MSVYHSNLDASVEDTTNFDSSVKDPYPATTAYLQAQEAQRCAEWQAWSKRDAAERKAEAETDESVSTLVDSPMDLAAELAILDTLDADDDWEQWIADRWALADGMAVRLMGDDDPINAGPLTVRPDELDPRLRNDAVLDEYAKQKARKVARDILTEETARDGLDLPGDGVTSLADELEQPEEPVRWLINGMFPAGGNVGLAAQYKAGKSTLAINLIRSIADGVPFLGHWDTHPGGNVAYFNYEVSGSQCRDWFRAQRIAHPERVHLLHLRGRRIPFTVSQVEDWAVEWLSSRNIDTWILDPFARAFSGGNENDNTEVGQWLEALDVIKRRAGVSNLVLIMHTGRDSESQGRARGATRLDDWPDARWVLTRKQDTRYLEADGRDVHVSTKRLGFDEKTHREWVAGESEKVEKERAVRQAVINVVALNPGITHQDLVAEIVDREEVNKTRAVDAVTDALSRGLLTRAGSGKRGDPFVYFGGGQGTRFAPSGEEA